jgi:beta-fructofuranosidase
MLQVPGCWIWDSWVADDGERYHLFFLKAPSALGDPDLRHTSARIGHASSLDLIEWDVHADALGPYPRGFDDLALWTGSVARGGDGVWRLYYTALSTEGRDVRDQRIGFAESEDLFTWRRAAEQPLVAPDPRWYRTDAGAGETWRDPFVFEAGGEWHMLITARAAHAPRLRDGVLAHARSADMVHWTLGPPLTEPAHFGQLEVSQVRCVDGQWLLLFTCHPDEQADPAGYCTWYVTGDSPLGPFDVSQAQPLTSEPSLFAAPLVQRRDGSWVLLGFREPHEFRIVDPIPFTLPRTSRRSPRRSAPGPSGA